MSTLFVVPQAEVEPQLGLESSRSSANQVHRLCVRITVASYWEQATEGRTGLSKHAGHASDAVRLRRIRVHCPLGGGERVHQ